MVEIKIKTEIIKLDAFLKWCGAVGGGSDAKMIVQNGEVKLNGEIETRRSKKLILGDVVEYDGEEYKIV